eukprot:2225491-Amphidinium_carterae.1
MKVQMRDPLGQPSSFVPNDDAGTARILALLQAATKQQEEKPATTLEYRGGDAVTLDTVQYQQ